MNAEFDLRSTDHLLTTTRSVRKRLDFTQPVTVDLMHECMEIALQAATGGNAQRWRWMLVFDEDKRRIIGEYYARAFREILDVPESTRAPEGHVEAEYHRHFKKQIGGETKLQASVEYLIENMPRAPVHVIACIMGRVRPGDTPHWIAGQFGSVFPAVWNLQLALRSRGLGSCLTSAHLTYEREVAELLGIPYDSVMQVCLLPVAHYTGRSFKPAARRPMNEVVFIDTFDESAAVTW